jgi:hypothetical protein
MASQQVARVTQKRHCRSAASAARSCRDFAVNENEPSVFADRSLI